MEGWAKTVDIYPSGLVLVLLKARLWDLPILHLPVSGISAHTLETRVVGFRADFQFQV